jgi:hypothetical protein
VTSNAGSGRHRKIHYAEIETDAGGIPFSVTWADGKKVSVSGQCPECRGLTSTEFSAGIPDASKFRGPKIETLPSPVTLYCECGHPHDERPADAPDRGCGRYWLLYVKAEERVPPGYRS